MGRWLVDGAHPGLACPGTGHQVHAVHRRAVYTKETAHLPTITSLLEDTSLYDEQHAVFLDLLEVAKNRPPLAVGAIYWDALTSAQGSVELNTKEPQAALQEVQDSVQPQLDAVGC